MKVPGSPDEINEIVTGRENKFGLNLIAASLDEEKNLHISNLQSSELAEI